MTHLILFDGESRDHLLPLTFTRPVADLRVGILTIKEKWEHSLQLPTSFLTQEYLEPLFPIVYGDDNLLLNGSMLPSPELIDAIHELEMGQAYTLGSELVAVRLDRDAVVELVQGDDFGDLEAFELEEIIPLRIRRPAHLFGLADQEIRRDFITLTQGRTSQVLSATNTLIGDPNDLFIEEGAEIEAAVLNVKTGPIYIGRDAKIMEGATLRGPIALGQDSVLKMGAKVYGPTSFGPSCKIGGEINNVTFQGNSNKGHDGFLGNAAIGQWCNIGADTNASNLKNDYSEVKVWSYPEGRFAKTGLTFHGLVMADHSKAGINTMFNTGTVVGVSANVFGEGFPRTFIPSFSWGGSGGFQTYQLDKAIATAERVMARRDQVLSDPEREMLKAVFEETAQYRPK